MNINRDNYEEYFLLYADNELSAAEKNIVELFLADNPDLKEEMRMLQQAILEPEEVLFENKGNLLKPQSLDTEIQQQLLLLLDNELAVNEKQHIESLIKNDEAVKKEWNLLQQTKLSVQMQLFLLIRNLCTKKKAAGWFHSVGGDWQRLY